MRISTLAGLGAGIVGASALSSFGNRLGRSSYNNVGNLLIYAVIVLAGAGPFVLTFFAMMRLSELNPMEGTEKETSYRAKWLSLLFLGIALLYGIAFIIWLFSFEPKAINFLSWPTQVGILKIARYAAMPPIFLGFLVGRFKRKKQAARRETAIFNQSFLDNLGFQEIPGSHVTHIDGDGNKLRLVNRGKDAIEFLSLNGDHAYIRLGPDGRFMSYSGVA